MAIKLKIKEIREYRNMTQDDVVKLSGVKKRSYVDYESGKTDIPSSKLQDIATALGVTVGTIFGFSNPETRDRYEDRVKDLSEFPKEKGIDDSEVHFKEDQEASSNPSLSKNGVPYYDVDFYGGFDFAFNDQTIQPSFMIDYAPYNDCDAWINVSGKSMSPFISHGDIAALKKLNSWQEFIPFGEIYAILTDEHKTIKIVTAGKDDDHLTLVPYNKSREFVEQQIPKKLIHQMYRVKGSIKKFF